VLKNAAFKIANNFLLFLTKNAPAADTTRASNPLDAAISTVASLRARFGAVQNRLEWTIRSLVSAMENTAAVELPIRGFDFACKTAELPRNQVLQQTGVSFLDPANFSPSFARSLLG
jgi:flagellin